MDDRGSASWLRRHERLVVAGLATLAVAVAVVMLTVLLSTSGDPQAAASPTATATHDRLSPPDPTVTPSPEEPWNPPKIEKSSLPEVDSWAVTPRAPKDPEPWVMPSGVIVKPSSEDGALLYTKPRGEVFAVLPVKQYLGTSAYPVVEEQGDWLRVLLTSRRELPSKAGKDGVNEASGWVQRDDVEVTKSPYQIVVNIAKSNATLSKNGSVVATTSAGVGTNQTPTPVTRTFVMSVFHDPAVTYSDVLLGLGAHSPTLDSFSGGPAPIAIHAFSSHEGKISNGCIRLSAKALEEFAQVPAGTPVLIVSGKAGEDYG